MLAVAAHLDTWLLAPVLCRLVLYVTAITLFALRLTRVAKP